MSRIKLQQIAEEIGELDTRYANALAQLASDRRHSAEYREELRRQAEGAYTPARADLVERFAETKAALVPALTKQAHSAPPLPADTGERTAVLLERLLTRFDRQDARERWAAQLDRDGLPAVARAARELADAGDWAAIEALGDVLETRPAIDPTALAQLERRALGEVKTVIGQAADAVLTPEQRTARAELDAVAALQAPHQPLSDAELRQRFRLPDAPPRGPPRRA